MTFQDLSFIAVGFLCNGITLGVGILIGISSQKRD